MKWKTKGITALSLVNSIIEFTAITNDKSQWSLEKQKSNLPRLLRLRRIESLIYAFIPELNTCPNIREKIEQVISGDFILLKELKVYKALEEEIAKEIDNSRFSMMKREKLNINAIHHNFNQLFKYKILLNNLTGFNSGTLEISYPYILSLAVTNSLSEQINSTNLDKFLTLMISPDGKSFSESDLIKRYQYPQEGLFEIDIDWR